jgi:hypothetical protein
MPGKFLIAVLLALVTDWMAWLMGTADGAAGATGRVADRGCKLNTLLLRKRK